MRLQNRLASTFRLNNPLVKPKEEYQIRLTNLEDQQRLVAIQLAKERLQKGWEPIVFSVRYSEVSFTLKMKY